MTRPTAKLLHQLTECQSPVALTIYMPVHTVHTSPAMREDRIRFKNLLGQTRDTITGLLNIKELIRKIFTTSSSSSWTTAQDSPRMTLVYSVRPQLKGELKRCS